MAKENIIKQQVLKTQQNKGNDKKLWKCKPGKRLVSSDILREILEICNSKAIFPRSGMTSNQPKAE
ncbi:CLUMA_CG017898, isoform A [Clunio marinus]|uniref:CLUMA_CG017898, isoform A n=1 Tax=Clunio marinus TaxID=568069 RepID=A0A1J1IXB8_9DIPT|nr:CLUMA_CG017898, isoform A [Clunio marinus]